MKRTAPGLILLLFVCLFGCESDFDVNADWKEIGVAYMILDHHDSVHYLKLNRAFVNTEGNANEIAQIEDSLYFNDENMRVTLIAGKNAGKQSTELYRARVEDKDDGAFAGPGQYLYRTPDNYQVDVTKSYTLEIENTRTKYKMTSEIRIAKNGTINWPFTGTERVGFASCNRERTELVNYIDKTMEISSARDVKFYDFDIVFHYREIDEKSPGDSVQKELNWPVGRSLSASSTGGNTPIKYKVTGESFFDYLALKLEPKEGVKRIAGNIDFEFRGGGQALFDYINVNTPSIGIVQKIPEYTNIENGLGVFSSRSLQVESLPLDQCTLAQLATGEKTGDLGFVR